MFLSLSKMYITSWGRKGWKKHSRSLRRLITRLLSVEAITSRTDWRTNRMESWKQRDYCMNCDLLIWTGPLSDIKTEGRNQHARIRPEVPTIYECRRHLRSPILCSSADSNKVACCDLLHIITPMRPNLYLQQPGEQRLQLLFVRLHDGGNTAQPTFGEGCQPQNTGLQIHHPATRDRGWRSNSQILNLKHHGHGLRGEDKKRLEYAAVKSHGYPLVLHNTSMGRHPRGGLSVQIYKYSLNQQWCC